MSNSIEIATYDIDLIEETEYNTWIDFWLNEEIFSPERNTWTVRTQRDELVEVELPFDRALLESLVMEEFTMVLEHLGCGSFEEFQRIIKCKPGADHVKSVQLVVRGVDGSVYLREYMFNAAALQKLAALCAKGRTYRVWSERRKG
jgi:hypothetical protein